MTESTPAQSSSVAAPIADRKAKLNMTDEQLALELGFERPSIITMIKHGTLKIPVQKVSALASGLSLDFAYLVLSETMPDVLAAVDALSTSLVLTANEVRLIKSYRYLSKKQDVRPAIMDGNSIIALVVA